MEMSWIGLLILLAGLVALVWAAFRARELFVLSVENGITKVARGRARKELVEALADVFARAKIQRAMVKVLRADGHVRMVARGLDASTLQRARNVLGTFPLHKLNALS
jgi:hypothetical protein